MHRRLLTELLTWLRQEEGGASDYLVLCLVNYAQLLQAYDEEGLRGSLTSAIQARLAAEGRGACDVLLLGYLVLVRLDQPLRTHAGAPGPMADPRHVFAEQLCTTLSCTPVECGSCRLLLSLRPVWAGSGLDKDLAQPAAGTMSQALHSAASAVAFAEVHTTNARQIRRDMAQACHFFAQWHNGQVALAFQPVVLTQDLGSPESSDSGTPLYYEALLRCADVRSLHDPAPRYGSCRDLVPALERLGMVECLDKAVMWTVIQILQAHPHVQLGCNLSALSLRRATWWQALFEALEAQPTLAARLTVEITETACIADLEAALEVLTTLRALGCGIALDDMGADGFNTLDLADQVQPDIIKLDKSLVRGAREPGGTWVSFCNWVGAFSQRCRYVVVEGVETREDLYLSRYAGAQAVQGYFMARPCVRPPWIQIPALLSDACGSAAMVAELSWTRH